MTTAVKIFSNDGKVQIAASAGQTSLAFDFPIFNENHITVQLTRSNVVTTLVLNTNYTVPLASVGQESGGTVTLVSPALSGDVYTLLLDVPYARTTDFNQAGDFFADTLNLELDLLTQQNQQINRDISSTLRFQTADPSIGSEIPLVSIRAGKYLAFDGSGNVIAADGTGGTAISAPMVPFVQAASLVAAKALLITAGSIATADIADGAVTNAKLANGSVTPDKLSTGGLYWDSSGRVGIGTSSLVNESKLTVSGNSISVTGADGNFAAGGNRALMDLAAGAARFGSVNGGGSATSVTFVSNNIESARIDSSGNFGINSGYGSVGTIYGCRAWVNFNGTGTVAIRASGNVSSITDNNVGDYTVNFSNNMPDGNYCWQINGQQPVASSATGGVGSSTTDPTASALRIVTYNAGANTDYPYVCVAIFR